MTNIETEEEYMYVLYIVGTTTLRCEWKLREDKGARKIDIT